MNKHGEGELGRDCSIRFIAGDVGMGNAFVWYVRCVLTSLAKPTRRAGQARKNLKYRTRLPRDSGIRAAELGCSQSSLSGVRSRHRA